MLRHLILLCSLLAVVGRGLAIHCWECNSFYNKPCATLPAGPQNKQTLPDDIRDFYRDCDEKDTRINVTAAQSKVVKWDFCRKQEQEINHEMRTVRGCGFEESGKECYKTTNPAVKTYVCECRGDGCNTSSTLSLNYFLTAISLFISVLISFNRFYK